MDIAFLIIMLLDLKRIHLSGKSASISARVCVIWYR